MRVGLYTVLFMLNWTDKMVEQVEQIRYFLHIRGLAIASSIQLTDSTGVHTLFVHRQASVLKIAKRMLPYCFKKKEELAMVVDYLEDRVTGNQVIREFNTRTLRGYRKGRIHQLRFPYSHSEGVAKANEENKARAAQARIVLSPREDIQVRRDRELGQLTYIELARKYGVSTRAIRNSLRR